MTLSRPAAAVVLVLGLLSGVVIAAGFVVPERLFDGPGLYLFFAAGVVELGCATVANRYDVLGALR